jgi:hypothetical protein
MNIKTSNFKSKVYKFFIPKGMLVYWYNPNTHKTICLPFWKTQPKNYLRLHID